MDTGNLAKKGIGELQRSLERFETYNDGFILPDTFLVVRLDAHRLGTWDDSLGEWPCGAGITKAFHDTARLLMTSSFRVLLAYSHGDEISLLVDPTEASNPIRRSKILSTFASAAAVHFLKVSGKEALFDARLSELPSVGRVVEYFFWQRRYCFRNASTIALRAALRASGKSQEEAEKSIHGISEKDRISKLRDLGISLQSIPHTTRRGSLFLWSSVMKNGRELLTLTTDTSLSDDDDQYADRLATLVGEALGDPTAQSSVPSSELAATQPANTDITASSTPATVETKAAPARHYRPNKKTNVSVFKMKTGS